MADTAFQTQFRQETIAAFEKSASLLRESVTTEAVIKGNQATFLVAGSGGATAVTRGVDGNIPGRAMSFDQRTAQLAEWHDVPEMTKFNIFSSQGDSRFAMQRTAAAVINRKIDTDIVAQLETATLNTGAAAIATLNMVLRAKTILGVNQVPHDGNIFAAVTPAFMAYLHMVKEFGSADYVMKKPLEDGEGFFNDQPGFYRWLGINFIEVPTLPGVGTAAEKCFMYHKASIGHAAPTDLIQTFADYDERNDKSWARATAYMGGKLLQTSGVVVMNHKGDELAAA